jgi:hypothetical protein
VEQRLRDNELPANASRIPDKETLCSLAQDLPAVWNSPATDMRLKQRIVRILVEEIIADVDDTASEVVLLIHWTGGRHSEVRMKKPAGTAAAQIWKRLKSCGGCPASFRMPESPRL